MKALFFAALVIAYSSDVCADDFSEATALHAKKDYSAALKKYLKSAEAGNSEAQYMVGEMYWFGDGTKPDLVNAERWFNQANQAGNQKAAEFVTLINVRKKNQEKINYFTTGFDGDAVRLTNFTCEEPILPQVSKTNAEIAGINQAMHKWQTCYQNFVAQLNSVLPVGSAIPAEIERILTEDEMQAARSLMDKTYAEISLNVKNRVEKVQQSYLGWKAETEKFVLANNEKTKREQEMRQKDLDAGVGASRDRMIGKPPANTKR